ncbi:MAG: hypothetical protein KDK04_20340 [Candidatus Competibacteraceae bacterium]|nr:hypothetical protein [Candidatus Competibacteraceae bacterium]
MNECITMVNEDGRVSTYRPLSARLPAFLECYGPAQGFAVVIEATDSLSVQPGLRRLYEQAIRHGHKPDAVGLPNLKQDRSMVFRARLEDATGRVLAMASAVKPVLQYKDYDVGETAARQRLLAALGFGGEVLDADEAIDQTAQGVVAVRQTAEPAPVNAPAINDTVADLVEPVVLQEKAEPAAVTATTIPPALSRQIAYLARLKNRPVPEYATLEDARHTLKQLMVA